MLRRVFFTFFLNTSLILAGAASAQSEGEDLRYISDLLVINIRDQLEKPFAVVGVVRSGDPVRIIEEQEGFAKIETADNKQGWIAKQYLKTEIPDSVIVQQLRQEISGLKKQLEEKPAGNMQAGAAADRDAETCTALQQKLSDAEKQIQQLQKQFQIRASTPGTSSGATQPQEQDAEITSQLDQTSQRYNQLVIEFEKRGQEIAELQNSMAKEDDTTRFLWFGAGAVVFFLGILAGRSANRKKKKFLY